MYNAYAPRQQRSWTFERTASLSGRDRTWQDNREQGKRERAMMERECVVI
jgi:hypothetical protein